MASAKSISRFFKSTVIMQSRILRDLMGRPNFWLVLLFDIILVILAYVLSYAVRFEFELTTEKERIISILPFIVVAKIPTFYVFGLYRGMWRYTSIADLINIAKSVAASSGIIIMTVLYFNRFEGFSRSVFFMDGIFTFLFLCMHRGAIRYFLQNDNFSHKWSHRDTVTRKKRLLIIGAGAASEKVIREIQDNQNVPYQVVGLVDDDVQKQGLRIHGIPVVGCSAELAECAASTSAEELLIAISSATGEQMMQLAEACRSNGLPFKVLPSIGEIIKGRLSVSAIRDIDYRDLLGRPSVNLDQKAIGSLVTDRTILVTGAGGSIGSELCRQIVRFEPAKLIMIDASEENLYKIQMELQHEANFVEYLPVLTHLQNERLIDKIFKEHNPYLVLHAAAYKHVPLIEINPWEAITNNVLASKTLIEIALRHNTDRFVLVSTDKAVRPTSVMGASKRLTELLMLDHCQKKVSTSFIAVRFGNVLGSSGSVIPLFKKQIARGGPVTVTDPEITRYFMSIDEAAQLILQAGAMGGGGEIFILKMGNPIRILDLAHDLIKLMGYQPATDIEIVYTGMRPGEKRYEELISEGEGILPTAHEKIMILKHLDEINCDLGSELNNLVHVSSLHSAIAIKEVLQKIVPEYSPEIDAESVLGK